MKRSCNIGSCKGHPPITKTRDWPIQKDPQQQISRQSSESHVPDRKRAKSQSLNEGRTCKGPSYLFSATASPAQINEEQKMREKCGWFSYDLLARTYALPVNHSQNKH